MDKALVIPVSQLGGNDGQLEVRNGVRLASDTKVLSTEHVYPRFN